MPGIDLCDFLINLPFDLGVGIDGRAGWHAHLHEGKPVAQVGTHRQQPVDRFQTLRNPFRVVEPVDTDADDVESCLVKAEFADELGRFAVQRRIVGRFLDAIEIDADRRDGHLRGVIVDGHLRGSHRAVCALTRFDSCRQLVADAHEKIASIALELKGQQVIGEQPADDLAAPWTHAQTVRIGPWNVPEEGGG